MSSEWMGRYRPLVAALVRHGNIAINGLKHRGEPLPGVKLSATEWQVMETVIEHQLEVTNMNRLAERIGLPQSTFSKVVSYLCGQGLVEKYQTATNRKNVILKPTELALQVYEAHSKVLEEQMFRGFFRDLDGLDDDALDTVIRALEGLNQRMIPAQDA